MITVTRLVIFLLKICVIHQNELYISNKAYTTKALTYDCGREEQSLLISLSSCLYHHTYNGEKKI